MGEADVSRGMHARCAKCRTDTGYLSPYPLLCQACEDEVVPVDMTGGTKREAYGLGYAAALWEAWLREFKARHPNIDVDDA